MDKCTKLSLDQTFDFIVVVKTATEVHYSGTQVMCDNLRAHKPVVEDCTLVETKRESVITRLFKKGMFFKLGVMKKKLPK